MLPNELLTHLLGIPLALLEERWLWLLESLLRGPYMYKLWHSTTPLLQVPYEYGGTL